MSTDTVRTDSIANWSGNVVFSTDRLHAPRSVPELQQLVASTPSIHAVGSRHSFNRIADTHGDLVSVGDLDLELELDTVARTVCVPAGVHYGAVGTFLQQRGWALHNMGSLPHITVAGACATGTHGSGAGNQALAAAAVAVEFVRGDGELVRVAAGDPTFAGSVISLGALGIVTRLWLSVQPTYDVRQDVWLDADLDAVIGDLDAVLGSGYSVSLFTHWHHTPAGHRAERLDSIWVKSRTGEPLVDAGRWGAHPATVAQHPIPGIDGSACTTQLGEPGPWNARLPHFRLEFTPSKGDEQQTEYFVPRAQGAQALEALRTLDLGPELLVSEIRTIAADDMWLSPFRRRDAMALHFTWVRDDELVARGVAAVEAAIAHLDVRPHWGKVFGLPAERVRAQYPMLTDFAAIAASYDPQRRFGNAYLQTYVYD